MPTYVTVVLGLFHRVLNRTLPALGRNKHNTHYKTHAQPPPHHTTATRSTTTKLTHHLYSQPTPSLPHHTAIQASVYCNLSLSFCAPRGWGRVWYAWDKRGISAECHMFLFLFLDLRSHGYFCSLLCLALASAVYLNDLWKRKSLPVTLAALARCCMMEVQADRSKGLQGVEEKIYSILYPSPPGLSTLAPYRYTPADGTASIQANKFHYIGITWNQWACNHDPVVQVFEFGSELRSVNLANYESRLGMVRGGTWLHGLGFSGAIYPPAGDGTCYV
ncbi:predicted protein [Plenodomus lingam JN3]|uniref:Predicted protein n=1 Tax=Leptosphaeria maculans (strain JN3 / isolate v23.1.3 / race Av1-4-5-6-7-8) TaxID=985895 RepID=E4ZQU1_LEPMJ|nr:predicted protein [Plenodomus lingam JN3]CBX94096.1 predicted protein [Plenodomus lingam JN3]